MKTWHDAVTARPVVALVAAAALLQACGALRPGFETPTVTVSSFRALPSQGVLPNFEIGLHVVNPNREALDLEGVSYTVSLNGHELVKGVSNELPVIEGYGQGDVLLTATPNLFAGVRLVTELMSATTDTVRYELEAKLDPGGLYPAIRVTDSGEISLRPSGNR